MARVRIEARRARGRERRIARAAHAGPHVDRARLAVPLAPRQARCSRSAQVCSSLLAVVAASCSWHDPARCRYFNKTHTRASCATGARRDRAALIIHPPPAGRPPLGRSARASGAAVLFWRNLNELTRPKHDASGAGGRRAPRRRTETNKTRRRKINQLSRKSGPFFRSRARSFQWIFYIFEFRLVV
jgi:hypothetical protein